MGVGEGAVHDFVGNTILESVTMAVALDTAQAVGAWASHLT